MTDTLYDHWIYQIIVYLYLLPLIIVQLSFYDGKFSCPSSNGHYSAKNWLTEKIFISVESWDHLLLSRIMSFDCATVFEHINWVEGCQNSSKFGWCIIIYFIGMASLLYIIGSLSIIGWAWLYHHCNNAGQDILSVILIAFSVILCCQ